MGNRSKLIKKKTEKKMPLLEKKKDQYLLTRCRELGERIAYSLLGLKSALRKPAESSPSMNLEDSRPCDLGRKGRNPPAPGGWNLGKEALVLSIKEER